MTEIEVLKESSFTGDDGILKCRIGEEVIEAPLVDVEKEGIGVPYKVLNPVQSAFWLYYEKGNCLVASSTSSGKTLTSILFWKKNRGRRFIYTAPTKALVWEKYREFAPYFKSIGIRTGDLIEDLGEVNQECVVATYESLLAAVRNRGQWFEESDVVVIDEIHLIRDEGRGIGIEELISYLLEEGKSILGLSATLPGAGKMARWINATVFINSKWRPVPLERKIYNRNEYSRKMGIRGGKEHEKIVRIVNSLNLKGKTIVFVPSKNVGWKAVETENSLFGKKILNETTPFEVKEGNSESKVAFHNADVPQEEREKIEKEFREGDLDLLYATQTLAYGVNLPADNVVIFVRQYSFGRKKFWSPDYLTVIQMEGRAGRFGLSDKGRSYIITTKETELYEKKLIKAMESDFRTGLMSSEEWESSSCQNRKQAMLSLAILGPVNRYGRMWRKGIKNFYTLMSSPDTMQEVEQVFRKLKEDGFIVDAGGDVRLPSLSKVLLRVSCSPFCFMEFLNRLRDVKKIKDVLPEIAYSYALRPLLRKELRKKTLFQFVEADGEVDLKEEFYNLVRFLALKTGNPAVLTTCDNWEVLYYYTSGKMFFRKNIARPVGELSNMSPDSAVLGQTLLLANDYVKTVKEGKKRRLFTFEEIHRILMMIRKGIPYRFSLLGAVKGLGFVRANALANAGFLLGYENEIQLINAVRETSADAVDALREVYGKRLREEKAYKVEKEIKAIVKALETVEFPLGEIKLLRFLYSLFAGQRKALKASKDEILEFFEEKFHKAED